MRLTRQMKEDFVFKAMKDMPKVDYQQQMQDKATAIAVSRMPAKVRAVWDDKALRVYLNIKSTRIQSNSCVGYVTVPFPSADSFDEALTGAERAELKQIHDAYEAQRDKRREAERLLKSAIESMSTLKQAREALPQFAKYLPEPEAKASLPAVMEADFVQKLQACGLQIGEVSETV